MAVRIPAWVCTLTCLTDVRSTEVTCLCQKPESPVMILTRSTSSEEATVTWTAPHVTGATRCLLNATDPVRDCCLLFPITHTAEENLSMEASATSCRLKPLLKPWQPLSEGFYFYSTPTTLLSPALTEDGRVTPSIRLMPPFLLQARIRPANPNSLRLEVCDSSFYAMLVEL